MEATKVQNLASGDWHVRAGREADFIARWTEFLEWTKANAPGFHGARLIRDVEQPQHFVSVAEWESHSARQSWRGLPDFPSKFDACRQLCEDMRGGNYDLAAAVEASVS
jgi:heme-degrading monooxygenase HmoA